MNIGDCDNDIGTQYDVYASVRHTQKPHYFPEAWSTFDMLKLSPNIKCYNKLNISMKWLVQLPTAYATTLLSKLETKNLRCFNFKFSIPTLNVNVLCGSTRSHCNKCIKSAIYPELSYICMSMNYHIHGIIEYVSYAIISMPYSCPLRICLSVKLIVITGNRRYRNPFIQTKALEDYCWGEQKLMRSLSQSITKHSPLLLISTLL